MSDGANVTPTFVTLGEASRRTGLSKTTLGRKIKSGEISVYEKGEDGAYRIDPSELVRFMDAARVQRATSTDGAVGPPPETPETPLLVRVALAETRLADLHALTDRQLADLRNMLADVRADRDSWRTQAEQAQAAVTRLLPGPPRERRGLWRWWRRA